MADQTNAEVSDERLREIEQAILLLRPAGNIAYNMKQGIVSPNAGGAPYEFGRINDAVNEAIKLLSSARRSVTSQASEGAGEPVAWRCFDEGSWMVDTERHTDWEPLYSAPVSKRVERLETALKDAEAELFEAEDKFWVAHCNYPNTTKPSFAAERQGQDKAFLATMSDRMKAARERARQTLQGDRS